eukprot:SAG31_NODE_4124_length_3561_cov_2.532062_1_plen_90_part_00
MSSGLDPKFSSVMLRITAVCLECRSSVVVQGAVAQLSARFGHHRRSSTRLSQSQLAIEHDTPTVMELVAAGWARLRLEEKSKVEFGSLN